MQLLIKFGGVSPLFLISLNRNVAPTFTKSESKLKLQLLGEGKLFEGGVHCAKNSLLQGQLVNEGGKHHAPIYTIIT